MRKALAPVLAFAASASALVVPRDGVAGANVVPGAGVTTTLSAMPVSTAISRAFTFTASNGSDVTFNIGAGFGIVGEDLNNAPPKVAKHVKIEGVNGYAELCKVVATQQEGSGKPLRDDCQALHDYIKNRNVVVYFEDGDADTARWAEIFWVGTCAFRAKTFDRDLVFSNADVANFLDRTLSRKAWTVNGRISASGEADCAVVEGSVGKAPMYWRLQERAASAALAVRADEPVAPSTVEARDAEPVAPLVVDSLEMIPKNTSAYVLHSHAQVASVDNSTDLSAIINDTVSKHFLIHTDWNIKGPNCKPTWLSSTWDDTPIPRRSDCEQLLNFVAKSNALIEFKERDLNYWAKFAAHGTCGIMFQTTKPKMIVNNYDMTRFVDNAVRWENCQTANGGTKARMGVKCWIDGDDSGEQFDGEFRLFWRNPNLPIGELDI
ncbi:hypothetical protein CkaCkLH20_02036 [Colletotrichum karsti]|uniref:Ecp2 effector protein-like domain-containing protein n=1 Tax=Colletotrichum karsti TaxID=1095194 RepID=A0A9P6LPW6_9PEZI|nr:uncharacterized protein CkaCkLH20_02036 [Colletotrichum karsti]KAF9880082.1 hypothetical protein CkaCkLH20_02036 [Colletotrichum karsti]